VEFAADNADATDFREFFGRKSAMIRFFSVIRGESKSE